jgi:hypothetical protein
MSCTLINHSKFIQSITRLHNFIIDNDKPYLGPIRLNADGTIDPTELQRFGVEPLPAGERGDEDPLGNLDFIADDALEYEVDVGQCARRQVIVNELQAKGMRRPARTLCGTL